MTDAQRAGKGMGVVEAMRELASSWVDATNQVICDRKKEAFDTLAAKLRAADELAEVATEAQAMLDLPHDRLDAALAAYKQAGMGGEGES